MVKITLTNGVVIEGTAEELAAMAKTFDAKKEARGIDEYKQVTDREPRVGDFAKWTESDVSYISVDKYYEITEVDEEGGFHFTDNHGDIISRRVGGIAGEEYAVYERIISPEGLHADKIIEGTPEPAPLKVGDYAKVIVDAMEYREGNIVKIIGDRENGDVNTFDFKVEFVNVTGGNKIFDQDYGYIDRKHLTHTTDEEVVSAKEKHAEAKAELVRKQAEAKEAERWASIGRKVNEFKKGDIVRVIEETGTHEEGTIVEIAQDGADSYYDYDGSTLGGDDSWFELITPVEARFDAR